MNGHPPLLIAIDIVFGIAVLVTPAAALYAFQVGMIGFEFATLGLLALLCYLSMLGTDDEPQTVFVNGRQETENETETEAIGGDDQW